MVPRFRREIKARTIPKKARSFAEFLRVLYSRRRGFLIQVTCVGSKVRDIRINPFYLFMDSTEFRELPQRGSSSEIYPDRIIMFLPGYIFVNIGDSPCPLSVKCQQKGVTSPCLPYIFKNMNLIPFRFHPVRT